LQSFTQFYFLWLIQNHEIFLEKNLFLLSFLGITSPPYRRTLWEWFELLIPHLPQCCQRTIRRRSKTLQTTRTMHLQSSIPQQIRVSIKNEHEIVTTTLQSHNVKNERVSLLQR